MAQFFFFESASGRNKKNRLNICKSVKFQVFFICSTKKKEAEHGPMWHGLVVRAVACEARGPGFSSSSDQMFLLLSPQVYKEVGKMSFYCYHTLVMWVDANELTK